MCLLPFFSMTDAHAGTITINESAGDAQAGAEPLPIADTYITPRELYVRSKIHERLRYKRVADTAPLTAPADAPTNESYTLRNAEKWRALHTQQIKEALAKKLGRTTTVAQNNVKKMTPYSYKRYDYTSARAAAPAIAQPPTAVAAQVQTPAPAIIAAAPMAAAPIVAEPTHPTAQPIQESQPALAPASNTAQHTTSVLAEATVHPSQTADSQHTEDALAQLFSELENTPAPQDLALPTPEQLAASAPAAGGSPQTPTPAITIVAPSPSTPMPQADSTPVSLMPQSPPPIDVPAQPQAITAPPPLPAPEHPEGFIRSKTSAEDVHNNKYVIASDGNTPAPASPSLVTTTAPKAAEQPQMQVELLNPELAELSLSSRGILESLPSDLTGLKQSKEPWKGFNIARQNPDRILPESATQAEASKGSKNTPKQARGYDANYELEKAYNALMAGDTEIAVGLYQSVLTNEPENQTALFGLATTWHRLGNLEKAAPIYGQLLMQDPHNLEALNNFLALVGEESPKIAAEQMERLAARNPDFSPIFAQLSILYKRVNNYKLAIENISKAMAASPENLTYKYNLAVLYDESEDKDNAIRIYRQLMRAHDMGQDLPTSARTIQERLTFLASN